MSFEIKEKDLLARIGKLTTKTRTIETPLLLPVINPAKQLIPPKDFAKFGFKALITNAYIIKKQFEDKPIEKGLHSFLDFEGALMTDSGAYQILVYGDVEVNPAEIVDYQEQIGTDIATILDIPTGWDVTEERAKRTVNTTIGRAEQLFGQKTRNDILWVGPVQGGKYLNLVAASAKQMGKLPFDIHALGSPTEVMERYRFDVLVDMIMTAKANLPIQRPLHLFGAGHPMMFSLAVALGCDLFDSASYVLYAKQGRYMTENGTERIEELSYFPCSCPRCSGSDPKDVAQMLKPYVTTFLAEHNLYACAAELRRIKQAIKEGRLWEHMEIRAHSHPALLQALRGLSKYAVQLEKRSPASKGRAVFYYSHDGLSRPEILRYENKLAENYTQPRRNRTLVLVPQTRTKPFHKSQEHAFIENLLRKKLRIFSAVHICIYCAPFGVVPIELDEVYPLSQHEATMPMDEETKQFVSQQLAKYVGESDYGKVLLIDKPEDWGDTVLTSCRTICRRKRIKFQVLNLRKDTRSKEYNR